MKFSKSNIPWKNIGLIIAGSGFIISLIMLSLLFSENTVIDEKIINKTISQSQICENICNDAIIYAKNEGELKSCKKYYNEWYFENCWEKLGKKCDLDLNDNDDCSLGNFNRVPKPTCGLSSLHCK